jgi:alkylation response protein AidB-like acyl-CoA dehydrogenase
VIAGVHVAEIAASAREVFERETPRDAILTRLRGEPLSHGAWRAAAEVGWFRLLTSASAGGLEAGPAELAALFREVGRYLPVGPFQETVVAGGFLRSLFDLGADDRLIGFGRSDLVEFADACDLMLLSIDLDGTAAIVAVDPRQDGVSITRLPAFDLVSSPCSVEVESAQHRLLLEGPQAAELLARIDVYDAIAAMATLAGISAEVLDRSVRYAKDRVQFDRPIGSFQAVQHRLADMAVTVAAIESGLSAAVALADGPQIDAVGVRALHAEAAKLARGLAESALQVHGGIGFTAEHPLHVYLKRTLRLQALAEAAGDPVATLGGKLLAAAP